MKSIQHNIYNIQRICNTQDWFISFCMTVYFFIRLGPGPSCELKLAASPSPGAVILSSWPAPGHESIKQIPEIQSAMTRCCIHVVLWVLRIFTFPHHLFSYCLGHPKFLYSIGRHLPRTSMSCGPASSAAISHREPDSIIARGI